MARQAAPALGRTRARQKRRLPARRREREGQNRDASSTYIPKEIGASRGDDCADGKNARQRVIAGSIEDSRAADYQANGNAGQEERRNIQDRKGQAALGHRGAPAMNEKLSALAAALDRLAWAMEAGAIESAAARMRETAEAIRAVAEEKIGRAHV